MEQNQKNIQHIRNICLLCQEKGKNLLEKGLSFLETNQCEAYWSAEHSKEEFVTKARYLHRGYYCPSLVRDIIISNSRRGKLLHKPTVRSNLSHHYLYDIHDRLQIAISFLPEKGRKKIEYLLYEDNARYGIAFDSFGTLVGLSEEVFENGKLKTYYCASCYVDKQNSVDFGITEIFYEEYDYKENGLNCVTCYQVSPYIEKIDEDAEIDLLIERSKYQLLQESGAVVGVREIDD